MQLHLGTRHAIGPEINFSKIWFVSPSEVRKNEHATTRLFPFYQETILPEIWNLPSVTILDGQILQKFPYRHCTSRHVRPSSKWRKKRDPRVSETTFCTHCMPRISRLGHQGRRLGYIAQRSKWRAANSLGMCDLSAINVIKHGWFVNIYDIIYREGNEAFVDDDYELAIKVGTSLCVLNSTWKCDITDMQKYPIWRLY